MKQRKRMGLRKAGPIRSRPMRGAARQSTRTYAAEMLRDIMEEQQLAAKQRRLLELAASRSQGDSTSENVVALLNRVA